MAEPTPEALGKALARAGDALSMAMLSLKSRECPVEQAIAELGRASDELRQARHVAEQLGSLATREAARIVAHFSHEMRTPLNVIVGWMDLLRADAAPGRQAVEVIQRNAARLDRLLTEMVESRGNPDADRVGRDRRKGRAARD